MLCPFLTLSCSQVDPGELETTEQSPLKLVTHCEDSRGQLEPAGVKQGWGLAVCFP